MTVQNPLIFKVYYKLDSDKFPIPDGQLVPWYDCSILLNLYRRNFVKKHCYPFQESLDFSSIAEQEPFIEDILLKQSDGYRVSHFLISMDSASFVWKKGYIEVTLSETAHLAELYSFLEHYPCPYISLI